MAVKIFRINYKSDFILTLKSDAGWMTPFCIKFWTGAPSQAYFVGYDGTAYTHCAPVAGEPTKLLVQFDDHHLPIGNLQFQIGYHFTVADFPNDTEDEVINPASIIIEIDGEQYQVMLDFTGETAPEIEFALPAYANEAQRIANEEQRIKNEQQRINDEQQCITNEEGRISAEATRQAHELQRIHNEEARIAEFASLKADAIAATDAANTAASLANEKAQLAADKAALAQAAATLANQKAQLAADEAALANAAAQLANEKAALAQQKAEYAQQQGGYAKEQGDYAKNQGDYAKEQGDTALADHQRAEADHGIAVDDHTQAENDHTRAESDHGISVDDHTRAGNDHTTAQSDHGIAVDDHTQAGNDHTRAEIDHGIAADDHTASVAATEAANQAAAGANALQENLENGTVIPALAENLASWAGSTQNANYTQEGVVETTGGDLSIDSSVPATLVSIAAKTDFSATKLIATGFNLLRRATAVGNGWYFMVPALPFGTINTASQPNGVLFTNEQGENLRPTVYFKPLSSGVPTSVTDGTACAYTDASTGGKNYRFFTTSQAGYLIVSGIDRAAACAHIGWSKRYDEYISVSNASDAGSEVDIAAGIHALHSYDKMLTVGNVADRIEKSGDNQITWHRLVDHVQPTWTNTPVESEGEPTGDYIHTATISGMKAGGAVTFETLAITLLVDGTTISFTDQNATVQNDYVKYELATEATGTASVSSSFQVEDWGLIIIQGAVGSAYINIAYAQGIPDSVRQMLSNIDNKTIPVIAEAMLYLYNENKALREMLTGKDVAVLPYIKAQNVECDDILTLGVPNVLYSSVAGAPSAANIPDNWDEATMDVWFGCPRKIGQQYVDKVSKKVYYAVAVTGSTSDWVVLN